MTGTAVGQHSLREQNLATVADAVFTAAGPVTRATIADRTGLTKATVSALVKTLLSARIVTELPLPSARGVGRPGVPIAPCPRSLVGLGLEIAAGYYGGRVTDLTGSTVAERIIRADLRGSTAPTVLRETAKVARALVADVVADGMRPVGARLAVPGLVRVAGGRLEVAPTLGWRDVDVPALLGLDDLPVEVRNEAKLAGLAQTSPPGALPGGRPDSIPSADLPATFVYVSGGVGIGSAIVLHGTLFEGLHGWSGEIGHVTVHPDGPVCRCGNRGCLEQYAGEDAIVAAARSESRHPITIDTVVADARAGDPTALRAVRSAGDALGRALADCINLIDIDTVVLGGVYAPLFDVLRPIVTDRLTRGVLFARHSPIDVRKAPQRDHAALTGGAWAALRTVLADPAAWLARSGETLGRALHQETVDGRRG